MTDNNAPGLSGNGRTPNAPMLSQGHKYIKPDGPAEDIIDLLERYENKRLFNYQIVYIGTIDTLRYGATTRYFFSSGKMEPSDTFLEGGDSVVMRTFGTENINDIENGPGFRAGVHHGTKQVFVSTKEKYERVFDVEPLITSTPPRTELSAFDEAIRERLSGGEWTERAVLEEPLIVTDGGRLISGITLPDTTLYEIDLRRHTRTLAEDMERAFMSGHGLTLPTTDDEDEQSGD